MVIPARAGIHTFDFLMYPELKFVRSLAWEDVFSLWRKSEAGLPRWIEHYKRNGFDSWDEWRKHTIADLHCEHLDWKLFEIEKPAEVVPHFLGGPFRAWIAKYYSGADAISFVEMVKNEELRQSQIVQEMIERFPAETCLIGLETAEGIVVIEGMHRSVALATAALEKKEIKTKIFIALAPFKGAIPRIGQLGSPT